MLVGWSYSLLSRSADQSLILYLSTSARSVMEQEILVKSLATELKVQNSKSLIQSLLLVLFNCGSMLSFEQNWVVKLLRTIQDCPTAQGGDALLSTGNLKTSRCSNGKY